MINYPSWMIYFFTTLLAFCSLFYELVYAQILSVCLGGTKNQYLTIIALFTCALGFGSLAQKQVTSKFHLRKTFFTIELLLTLLGSVGPFLITWLLQPDGTLTLPLRVSFSYLIVFFIGLLSGFEIPCLFSMLKGAEGKVLAFDYLGMLIASVSFPFIFLPYLGAASSTLMAGGMNALALIWLRSDHPEKYVTKILYILAMAYFLSVFLYRNELNHILSNLYLGGL